MGAGSSRAAIEREERRWAAAEAPQRRMGAVHAADEEGGAAHPSVFAAAAVTPSAAPPPGRADSGQPPGAGRDVRDAVWGALSEGPDEVQQRAAAAMYSPGPEQPRLLASRRCRLALTGLVVVTFVAVAVLTTVFNTKDSTISGLIKQRIASAGAAACAGARPERLRDLAAVELTPAQAAAAGLLASPDAWARPGQAETHVQVTLQRSERCPVASYNWTLLSNAEESTGSETDGGASDRFEFVVPALNGQTYRLYVFPWDPTGGAGPESDVLINT